MSEQPRNRTGEERRLSFLLSVVHHGDTVTSAGGKLALLNSFSAATTRKQRDSVTLERTWTRLCYNYFNLIGWLSTTSFLMEFSRFPTFVGVSC